jgi:hypothetical protein
MTSHTNEDGRMTASEWGRHMQSLRKKKATPFRDNPGLASRAGKKSQEQRRVKSQTKKADTAPEA